MSKDDMADSDVASSPATSEQSPASQQRKTPSSKKKSGKASKPRLTAVQKNTNHKDAENKRRNAIRERFTELSRLVPEAEGQERSEQIMLAKTKVYLEESLREIRKLHAIAEVRGIFLKDEERLKDSDFGGSEWKPTFMDEYEAQKRKKDDGKPVAQVDGAEDEEDG